MKEGKDMKAIICIGGTDRNKNELIDVDSIIKYTKIWRWKL